MKIDLSGKTAIVTGSTEGIGEACALGLAAAGAEVVINGRKPAVVEAKLAALREKLPEARFRAVAADLGTAEGCAALVAAVKSPDILVNNVGIYDAKPFFDIPDEDWQRFFDVNVMSGVRLSRAYMGGMMERDWGRVIFLSSESGINIPDDMLHYGFTKTAVLSLSRGLAKMARGTGVTVNAVLPARRCRRGGGHARRRRGEIRQDGRAGRPRLREDAAADLDHPARRLGRGGGQHGGLRLLAASLGHDRLRPARRGRHRRVDRLIARAGVSFSR